MDPMRLAQEQYPLESALGDALLETLPSHWSYCLLHAEEWMTASGSTVAVGLQGQESPGIGLVTEAVIHASQALFVLYRRYGHPLQMIEYTYRRQPDGSWSFSGRFQYRQPS